jgi:hypothetical protein
MIETGTEIKKKQYNGFCVNKIRLNLIAIQKKIFTNLPGSGSGSRKMFRWKIQKIFAKILTICRRSAWHGSGGGGRKP